ncbi:acetylxylan esterase [Clostridium sp. LIBA-8841]|uniref:acetylxylan esterase n=1 Tax=Clostridium sp. LIBA-8841 TaxID=2987530 RepID=UPI002AC7AA82|nr:acetylxylan esterase [Clostridium sp. LIBA-8841]MDZ5252517.1 acetylxylan esterase [Clostridium sp. LIBA-8841]
MPMLDMSLEKLYEYKGVSPLPKDFDEFWDKQLKELDNLDVKVEMKKADFQSPIAECYDLYFNSIDGAKIYAKFMKPKGVKGKMPALLEFHGYQGRSTDWSNKLHYVASGMCVISMDCRGQAGLSEDVGGVKGITVKGHIVRGLVEGREKLLFKNIFLDTVVLARIIMNMECVDEDRVITTGGSQGGALSLACAALENRIKGVYAYYPFLCDYKRVWFMDLGGEAYDELKRYFKFIDPNHENEEYVFNTLGYIDIKNMAHRIKGKVNMAIGLMDDICPPSTQFAAYNNILCEKELVLYPDYGHEPYLPKLNDRIYQWAINV